MSNPIKLLNPLSWLAPVGDVVVRGIEAVRGNQREQDQQVAGFRTQVAANYVAEFAPRSNRTWWDSLWDGLNRAPRPVLVGLVIAYFVTSWTAPAQFARINAGLATVPEPMWWTLGAIVTFYFAARELSYKRNAKAFEQSAHAAQVLAGPTAPPRALPAPDTVNPSIIEWRSQQADQHPPPTVGAVPDDPLPDEDWDDW